MDVAHLAAESAGDMDHLWILGLVPWQETGNLGEVDSIHGAPETWCTRDVDDVFPTRNSNLGIFLGYHHLWTAADFVSFTGLPIFFFQVRLFP